MLPGAIHIWKGEFPFFGMKYSISEVFTALIIVLVFLIFMMVGYLYRDVRKSNNGLLGLRSIKIDRRKLKIVTILLAIISLVSASYVGYGYLHTDRGTKDFFYLPLTPIGLVMLSLARIAGFLSFLYSLINFKFSNKNSRFLFLLIGILVLYLSNNPLSTPRFIIAGYVFILFFVFIDLHKSYRLAFISAILVSQVTVFPIISELSRGDISNYFEVGPINYYMNTGDFDGFQSTMNVVALVNEMGLQFGRNLMSAVLFFIPREYWSEKSIGLGGESADNIGYTFINISSPLPAEFYADFGLLGVIVFSTLFGMLLNRFDTDYSNSQTGTVFVKLLKSIPAAVFAGYLIIIMRGSLVGVLGPFCVAFFLVILANKYIMEKT